MTLGLWLLLGWLPLLLFEGRDQQQKVVEPVLPPLLPPGPLRWQNRHSSYLIYRDFLMGRVGIEPTTLGLKVPCSAN